MKLLKNHPLFSLINSYLIDSAEPLNISYLWNFGSLLGVCLVIQIITGITLAMHYTPSIDAAFISVEHIMRDVNYGWLIRYLHANTASFFFLFVYAHMARGLYYGSYRSPRVLVWSIGVVIFLVMIITAFLGYVLPYGQMSLWGATVITNLMSAIPWIGQDIVEFIWGGFSVSNATLNRFFSLHYLLPFVLAALIIMHMIALHESGSNNPVGVTGNLDRLPLHPYFIFKDLVTIVAFFLVLSLFVFYAPNVLGHSDNYIPANPMQTPASIVPEWYLLPFYAILRSIPNKLLGVLAMIAAILVLFLMPIVDLSRLRGNAFKPFSKIAFAIFAVNFLLLMWLGSQHVESPYVEIGQICTAYYFAHFLVIIPAISVFENTLMDVALSDNDNKNSANSVKLNLSINTPLNGLLLKKGGSLAPSPFKEARLFFNSSKIKTLTEYKLIIKNFIIDVFLEIKFVFFNPLTTLKLIFNFFISNKKYLFKFKNFSVSLIIVTLVPRLAPFSADYASYYLDNYNSQEYPLYLNLLLFYFFAFITYFIFALVLYQSILLILFAFKKGTTIQKILAVIFFVNSFSYVFAIINSFIDFKYYISKFISTPLYCSDGNFPSSPGLNPFNDHTGRGEFQPPVNINPEIKAGYDSAIKILEEKRSITERYGIAIGTGTCAKLALQSNSKLLATGFAIGSAISAVSATTEVFDSFKTNYDEGMKKAE